MDQTGWISLLNDEVKVVGLGKVEMAVREDVFGMFCIPKMCQMYCDKEDKGLNSTDGVYSGCAQKEKLKE